MALSATNRYRAAIIMHGKPIKRKYKNKIMCKRKTAVSVSELSEFDTCVLCQQFTPRHGKYLCDYCEGTPIVRRMKKNGAMRGLIINYKAKKIK